MKELSKMDKRLIESVKKYEKFRITLERRVQLSKVEALLDEAKKLEVPAVADIEEAKA